MKRYKIHVYYNEPQDVFLFLPFKRKNKVYMFGIREDEYFRAHYVGIL